MMNQQNIKKAVKELLIAIGENPSREGLKRTPLRVAKAYTQIFDGYKKDPKKILNRTFTITESQMVIWKNITFDSFCEHHVLPFSGLCHIGYIPEKRVIGLDKFVKLVNCFAHRLQIQEQLTGQIARSIQDILKPDGVGVVIEAKHDCVALKDTRNKSTSFITTVLLGSFLEDEKTRAEFLNRIK